MRIINVKTNLSKEIDIEMYHPIDLNDITDFYDSHNDYIIERI